MYINTLFWFRGDSATRYNC